MTRGNSAQRCPVTESSLVRRCELPLVVAPTYATYNCIHTHPLTHNYSLNPPLTPYPTRRGRGARLTSDDVMQTFSLRGCSQTVSVTTAQDSLRRTRSDAALLRR